MFFSKFPRFTVAIHILYVLLRFSRHATITFINMITITTEVRSLEGTEVEGRADKFAIK